MSADPDDEGPGLPEVRERLLELETNLENKVNNEQAQIAALETQRCLVIKPTGSRNGFPNRLGHGYTRPDQPARCELYPNVSDCAEISAPVTSYGIDDDEDNDSAA